jgi:DNA polymerase III delta prime subunit
MEHMIVDTLKDAGASHIEFNPLTLRACVKQLKRIASAEGMTISDEALAAIAESSRCDLFNAIQSMRLHLLGADVKRTQLGKGTKKASKSLRDEKTLASARQERDMGLHLFHALGKILYNKRFDASGKQVTAPARCAAAALRQCCCLLLMLAAHT